MVEQAKGMGGLTDMDKIELVEDLITQNEEFKKNVAIPYFKDIYKDLVNQSDDKNKGINRVALLTVSAARHSHLVFVFAGHHWRAVRQRDEPEREWVRGPARVRARHVQGLLLEPGEQDQAHLRLVSASE